MKKAVVHILATVRKPELLPAATLVFDSLRTGFPDATVKVWGNALTPPAETLVRMAAGRCEASFCNLPPTVHDVWIETLVKRSFFPFWVVDTDVVFFGELPVCPASGIIAGRFEPQFHEEWTRTLHVERLHTAVMWIDPSALREAAREWMARFPQPWRSSAEFPWVRQCFVPAKDGLPLFYDTMAGVYHAMPERCSAFSEPLDECFEHLHCGGYVDLVAAETESGFGASLQSFHQRVFVNPEAARGARLRQAEYYAMRKDLCNTRPE